MASSVYLHRMQSHNSASTSAHDDRWHRMSSHQTASDMHEGSSIGSRCTAGRLKTCLKVFFARLFSHVGLCALVIGYAIMGAFLFVALEKDNEMQTRMDVGETRRITLNELYNVTGPLRSHLVNQERRIAWLTARLRLLSSRSRQCHVAIRRQENFLLQIVENCQSDNVPVSVQQCRQFCLNNLIEETMCEAVCTVSVARDRCHLWHREELEDELRKEGHFLPNSKYYQYYANKAKNRNNEEHEHNDINEHGNNKEYDNEDSDNEDYDNEDSDNEDYDNSEYVDVDGEKYDEVRVEHNSTEELSASFDRRRRHDQHCLHREPRLRREQARVRREDAKVALNGKNGGNETNGTYEVSFFEHLLLPEDTDIDLRLKQLMEQNNESDYSDFDYEYNEYEENDENEGEMPKCRQLTCVTHQLRVATVCFRALNRTGSDQETDARTSKEIERDRQKFNVLWRENWTLSAGAILKSFEKAIIRKAKTEGYDGGDEDDQNVQWNFSGALLYSVTVITTIGYGNISPKTPWGQAMTMIYAIFGLPLFFIWASQMGTFLAHTFQFFYSNVCCVLCRQGRRRRLLALRQRHNKFMLDLTPALRLRTPDVEETPKPAPAAVVLHIPEDEHESSVSSDDHEAPSPPKTALNTRMAKKRDVSVNDLTNDARHVLATCAKYNLENRVDGQNSVSAQVLQDLLNQQSHPKSPVNSNNQEGNLSNDNNASNEMELATPTLATPILATPSRGRRGRSRTSDAHHQSPSALPQHVAQTQFDSNSNTTSTLLATPPKMSVATPSRRRSASVLEVPSEEQRSINDSKLLAIQQLQQQLDNERVPVLPVLTFVTVYITVGALIFSGWEHWSFLEGAYFCFITLTTIGFGDFVPGDAVLNDTSEHGQAKLIIACVYVLIGLAVVAMSINLVQEEILERLRLIARDMGIVDDDDNNNKGSNDGKEASVDAVSV